MFLLAKQTAGTFLVQETGPGWGRINWTFDQVGKLRVPVHESGLIASSKPVEPSSLHKFASKTKEAWKHECKSRGYWTSFTKKWTNLGVDPDYAQKNTSLFYT